MLSSILANVGKYFGLGRTTDSLARERFNRYMRMQRLYDGFVVRVSTMSNTEQGKELAHNLARNAADTMAAFVAGPDGQWKVTGADGKSDAKLEAEAALIWSRSGGHGRLGQAILTACIKGDACIVVRRSEETAWREAREVFLSFLDPGWCLPVHNAHDVSVIDRLTVAYPIETDKGEDAYFETYSGGQVYRQTGRDGERQKIGDYNEALFGGAPAVWVAHGGLLGEKFGRSDIAGCKRLFERYDHLSEKREKIVDYYSKPNLVFVGVKGPESVTSRSFGDTKAYFLPDGADLKFVEWSGQMPAVKDALDQERSSIAEVTGVPEIAAGRVANLGTNVSGVALRVLYGPVVIRAQRHRDIWGAALARAMAMALRESINATVDDQSVSYVWQEALPSNDAESWQVALDQKAVGVSTEQVLLERGYLPELIEEMEEAKDEEAIRTNRAMNAGLPNPKFGDPAGGAD